MCQETRFNNGLRLVTARMPGMSSVAAGIWIKAGGRWEDKKNNGISHLLEHLLFKGSRHYTCRQIKQAIEGLGGSLNAFTGQECTCYLVKIIKSHLVSSLKILADMVIAPLLKEGDICREKKVILEEIRMYKDIPQRFVNERLCTLLWPDHPLGFNLAGSFESVSGINRMMLETYRRRYYTPARIAVVICGDISHREALGFVGKIFPVAARNAKGKFLQFCQRQKKFQLAENFKQTEQTHLALGWHALSSSHPQRYALDLLNIILGANMSSRLFDEVREKRGLAYEIDSSVKKFADTGALVINAGIATKNINKALKVILGELGKISRRAVSRDELNRAKEYYRGQMLLSLEDTMGYMLWLGASLIVRDRIYKKEEVLKKVSRVDAGEILDVARKVFKPQQLNFAWVGPVEEKLKTAVYRTLAGA